MNVWIPIQDQLPDKFEPVFTRLYGGDTCANSIQETTHRHPDGSSVKLEQWAEHNVRVTHWCPAPKPLPREAQGGE